MITEEQIIAEQIRADIANLTEEELVQYILDLQKEARFDGYSDGYDEGYSDGVDYYY
jgi:hypothetical protein